MELIKGLESGLFCLGVTGNSAYRTKFSKTLKEHLDKGTFIREIRNAPRDARYKIDWYFKEGIDTERDTIDFEYINFHENTLKFLGIDESFNPTEDLRKTGSYKCENGFELCYGEQPAPDPMGRKKDVKYKGYYFKYKDEPCRVKFQSRPEIVDYTDEFWARYKGYVDVHNEFDTLMHNIGYYIEVFNVK